MFDGEWAEQLSSVWKRVMDGHWGDARILENAAEFYFAKDRVKAEEILLRGMEIQPERELWSKKLEKLRQLHLRYRRN